MKYSLILIALMAFTISPLEAADNSPIPVKDVPFVADYFPSDSTGKYGVIVLTGSSGGKYNSMAQKLNDLGYATLSLAYFDRSGEAPIPDSLELIPLEYIDAAKTWLMRQKDTRNDGVIVYGVSKGAELALVLAAHNPEYKGVIAVAPSSVVWSGIPNAKRLDDYSLAPSSWSVKGRPLAFIPYVHRAEFRDTGSFGMLNWHQASLDRAKDFDKALIKVKHITAPMLMLSGGKDTAWPSNAMGIDICNRANAGKDKPTCTHINYDNSGHMLGGSLAGAEKQMAEFLKLLNP